MAVRIPVKAQAITTARITCHTHTPALLVHAKYITHSDAKVLSIEIMILMLIKVNSDDISDYNNVFFQVLLFWQTGAHSPLQSKEQGIKA